MPALPRTGGVDFRLLGFEHGCVVVVDPFCGVAAHIENPERTGREAGDRCGCCIAVIVIGNGFLHEGACRLIGKIAAVGRYRQIIAPRIASQLAWLIETRNPLPLRLGGQAIAVRDWNGERPRTALVLIRRRQLLLFRKPVAISRRVLPTDADRGLAIKIEGIGADDSRTMFGLELAVLDIGYLMHSEIKGPL